MRPLAPPHAKPHLARLRSRRDVGNGGLTFFCALFATLVLTSVARAAPVQEVTVRETGDLAVKVRVVGTKAPTFQVFRLPGRDAFAVELPGADVSGVRAELAGEAVFLESAKLEKSGTPRVVVHFHGEVDYDASTKGGTLEVVFSPLGDRAALRKAAAERRARTDQRNSAQADLRRTNERLAELKAEEDKLAARLAADKRDKQQALQALEKKAEAARAQLANLEKRRTDENGRIESLRRKAAEEHKAFEAARSRTAKAEQDRAAVQKQIAGAKQELTRVRDEVRLAREKSELKKVEEARAAEEKRLAGVRDELKGAKTALARTQKEASSVEQRAKAAATRVRELAQQRGAAETELKNLQERKKSAEVQVASLVDRQTREQDHLREILQQTETAKARLAALENDVRERSSRLAAVDGKLRKKAQRLANLDGRVQQAEARLSRAQQQLAMKQARAQQARPAPAPRTRQARAAEPAPRGRISVASAQRDGSYGFGGRSVDLDKRNRYRRADKAGYDLDEPGRGQLSHITVRRGDRGASEVGVRVDGGASYSIARRSDNELVLTLYDTRAANLDVRRILDARDLGSSVLRVLPRVREGSQNRVELTIELRDDAPVRVGSDESMLWLHVGQG